MIKIEYYSKTPVDVCVDNNDDYKALREGANPIRTTVSGGEVFAEPSRAGKIIYKVLKD